jgi:hypothetical protein
LKYRSSKLSNQHLLGVFQSFVNAGLAEGYLNGW